MKNYLKKTAILARPILYFFLNSARIHSGLYSNKRVAIVGPAIDLNDNVLLEKINEYDIAVFVNKTPLIIDGYLKKNLISGHLYRSFNIYTINQNESDRLDDLNIQYIISGKPFENFKKVVKYYLNGGKKKIWLAQGQLYNKLENNLRGKRPTTGMCAIWYVLNGGARKVFITGFTFYQYENIGILPYNENYRANERLLYKLRDLISKKHDCDREFELFKDLLNSDRVAISIDERLTEIINRSTSNDET